MKTALIKPKRTTRRQGEGQLQRTFNLKVGQAITKRNTAIEPWTGLIRMISLMNRREDEWRDQGRPRGPRTRGNRGQGPVCFIEPVKVGRRHLSPVILAIKSTMVDPSHQEGTAN